LDGLLVIMNSKRNLHSERAFWLNSVPVKATEKVKQKIHSTPRGNWDRDPPQKELLSFHSLRIQYTSSRWDPECLCNTIQFMTQMDGDFLVWKIYGHWISSDRITLHFFHYDAPEKEPNVLSMHKSTTFDVASGGWMSPPGIDLWPPQIRGGGEYWIRIYDFHHQPTTRQLRVDDTNVP